MQRYEYMELEGTYVDGEGCSSGFTHDLTVEDINKAAIEGWRVVQVVYNSSGYLRRALMEKELNKKSAKTAGCRDYGPEIPSCPLVLKARARATADDDGD